MLVECYTSYHFSCLCKVKEKKTTVELHKSVGKTYNGSVMENSIDLGGRLGNCQNGAK